MESFEFVSELDEIYEKLERDWHAFKESTAFGESSSETWKSITIKDVASQEIFHKRKESIESGKFKGRRLFQSSEEGESDTTDDNDNMMDPYCKVKSMSLHYSKDEHGGFMDKDHTVAKVEDIGTICRPGKGIRTMCAVFLGGFLLMVAFAICMSLGGHDYDVVLVPT